MYFLLSARKSSKVAACAFYGLSSWSRTSDLVIPNHPDLLLRESVKAASPRAGFSPDAVEQRGIEPLSEIPT